MSADKKFKGGVLTFEIINEAMKRCVEQGGALEFWPDTKWLKSNPEFKRAIDLLNKKEKQKK